MLNFFEFLVHKSDLKSITVIAQQNRLNPDEVENRIIFQKKSTIYKAEQKLNFYSILFSINVEAVKTGDFYYIKCMGNFPPRCNRRVMDLVRNSLKEIEKEESEVLPHNMYSLSEFKLFKSSQLFHNSDFLSLSLF